MTQPTIAPLGPAALQGNSAFATSIALLLIRLVLGWVFIYHGAGKAFGAFGGPGIEGIKGVGGMMPGFLPPMVWVYMLAYGELAGGVAIFLGLLTRLGTLPIIVTMLVAIAKVHGPNGFGNHMNPAPPHNLIVGYEYNLALLAMCAAILIAGPGLISLDAILFRRSLWARGAQPLGNAVARVP